MYTIDAKTCKTRWPYLLTCKLLLVILTKWKEGVLGMKKWISRLRKPTLWNIILPTFCGILLVVFSGFYFSAYTNPIQKNMVNISSGWNYSTNLNMSGKYMEGFRYIDIPAGEPLFLSRVLVEDIDDAVLMFKSNHQRIKIFLDEELIFEIPYSTTNEDPRIGLHFVKLPVGYQGKLLQMEVVSPYASYSGTLDGIYIGDIASLEAYALPRSVLRTLIMVPCLVAGGFMMILSGFRRNQNGVDWGNFSFGVFCILWGFHFPGGDFMAHRFFEPMWVSFISLGLYYLYPLPMTLYFYFGFTKYRKALLPVLILRALFIVVAFALQFLGIMNFSDMLIVHNPFYVLSIIYIIVLCFIERRNGNKFARITIPWFTIAFLAFSHRMTVFYSIGMREEETLYEAGILLFIMAIWIYNCMEFFRIRDKERKDLQELCIKNEVMLQSYEDITKHLEQVSLIRHEMKKHVAAMQILMDGSEYEKTQAYLSRLLKQQENIFQVRYCEHYLLNAIIGTYLFRLKRNGVHVSYNISVAKELMLPDDDISSFMMNLLDNATEALEKQDGGESEYRWMTLKIYTKKPYFYVYLKNAKSNSIRDSNGEYISTKDGDGGRGYGLKVVKGIVKKHDGILNISYTDNTFTVEAALKEGAE